MINWLKDAAKALPYPLFLRLFYLKYLLFDLRQQRRIRKKLGIPLLSSVDLAQNKNSNTLFILGSGSSINNISEARWRAIARHDTAGFNFWPFHPVVPKFYFIEAISHSEQPDMYPAYRELAERRQNDYRSTLRVATNLKHDVVFPGDWWKDMRTIYVVPIAARNASEIRAGLKYLERKKLFAPSFHIELLYKQASTLSSLLSFAIRMQYDRVVLCGVDLRDSRYFYQAAGSFLQGTVPQFLPPEAPHPTNVAIPWNTPVKEVVLEMYKHLLEPGGIELFVENRSSALFPEVPEAPSSLFE
jgi:hypothetical protein